MVCDCNLQRYSSGAEQGYNILYFVGPNSPLGKTDTRVICGSLAHFLKHSLWTSELEHAFEKFSFGAFLDRVIVDGIIEDGCPWRGSQAKKFFEYLEANVSLPRC